MGTYTYLKDKDFLKALDNSKNKFFWVKIEVLDSSENPIKSIEGRVQSGSTINLNGSSSVRRTCNLNIIAEDIENDLTDIDNLLSANKKIKIFEGLKNTVGGNYDDIIWFPLGVFVIIQPNISHTSNGCTIQLSCKDKMCLLNGECAGGLPTSITFHEYDQIIGLTQCNGVPSEVIEEPNNYTIYSYNDEYWSWSAEYGWKKESNANSVGQRTAVPQLIYDIIQTLVCNYGGESLSKIFINDVPLEIKQLVRFTGSGTLHYNTATGFYTLDDSYLERTAEDGDTWRHFSYNEDVGYVYTDFIYPGSLVSGIGDNVCSVLDKIKNTLGNYEYFYDVEGNFVFQEIKNYLNNSYLPLNGYRLDDGYKVGEDGKRIISLASNGLSILDNANYEMDIYSNSKSVYTFNEGSGLITSFNNAPNYTNLKNDFHVWGENEDGYAIHFHVAIKDKPKVMNTYNVVFIKKNDEYTGALRLANDGEIEGVESYTPDDWRAELYLQGLVKQQQQIRPDIYEQELLDLFDIIYNFKDKEFKAEMVYKPNVLTYFFDYIEPVSRNFNHNNIYDCSVDTLGPKVYSYQLDKINRLYNVDVPNTIMINVSMDSDSREKIIERCMREGQPYSNVNEVIYSKIAIGTAGYTAQETARDLLYQYTNYNESISIQSIPIYYLDVNSRITVQDMKTGIYGDYIINSISLPLDAGGTMNISASRALERI